MLIGRSVDIYRPRNINDDADLMVLKVACGPSGIVAAFWGYCVQSHRYQLDVSLPSYGLTTVGRCAVLPLPFKRIDPSGNGSTHSTVLLDQQSYLKKMMEYPRNVLWHPLGRSVVVAELGVLYMFSFVWIDKRTNEKLSMVEATRRLSAGSNNNLSTSSMDDDMIPSEVLSVEIQLVKQLDLHVTALSHSFSNNNLLLGTCDDAILMLDWEGNRIPLLSVDHKHIDELPSAAWTGSNRSGIDALPSSERDRAILRMWESSSFSLHTKQITTPGHAVTDVIIDHIVHSDCATAPSYVSTEEIIKEIACDDRSQMLVALFADGSFSVSILLSGSRSMPLSDTTTGSHYPSTTSIPEHDEGNATGGSRRVSVISTDRIHAVALVAYPFVDDLDPTKLPAIYELSREQMIMKDRVLRSSIYSSSDYVTSFDVDGLLDLTPTLHKKVCRMRSLVTGHSKEELCFALAMQLIDNDIGSSYKNTADDESPVTIGSQNTTTSTGTATQHHHSSSSLSSLSSRRIRLLVLMRTKHLLHSTVADAVERPSVGRGITSSSKGTADDRRRSVSYSLVVLEFIAKGSPSTIGLQTCTSEVAGKCIKSVCVGRTTHCDGDIDVNCYQLDIIRLSQYDAGLYAILLCDGVITCRPIQALHSVLFRVNVTRNYLYDSSSLMNNTVTSCLHAINVSVALSKVIVSVWGQDHLHDHSPQQPPDDDSVFLARSKIIVLSMTTALSASSGAGGGCGQCEGVFADYSRGQLSFEGPSMSARGWGGSYKDKEDGDGGGSEGSGDYHAQGPSSGDYYKLLRLPVKLNAEIQGYQQQCIAFRRGVRRPSPRTYQHGLLVATSAQRRSSSIDIGPEDDVHLNIPSMNHNYCMNNNSTANSGVRMSNNTVYLACIAGGSVAPHRDRIPIHKKPFNTHQQWPAPPLLWIYNCTTHRWRGTHLTIGSSLSNASSFVDIPTMNSFRCGSMGRHLDNILSPNGSVPSTPMMSAKTADSVYPPSPINQSFDEWYNPSFNYGDFSNHLDVRLGDFRDFPTAPVTPPKHRSPTSNNSNNINNGCKGKRLSGFEPRGRSTSALISEHSHLVGGDFIVFAVAWYGTHTIVLLTRRRAFHCLEIVSREVTKASSIVGTPHPAFHKIVQLPPGYLPTILETRNVSMCARNSNSETVGAQNADHLDGLNRTQDSYSGGFRIMTYGADSCVVVVSDGRTMLCYQISRELQQLPQQQQKRVSSSLVVSEQHMDNMKMSRDGRIADYSIIELWDMQLSSLVEQSLLFGSCMDRSVASSLGQRIVLPIRETHLFFRSCQFNDELSIGQGRRVSSALLLLDGQGKAVFVDPVRKLFNVVALGPLYRIVPLDSDSLMGSSNHRHHHSFGMMNMKDDQQTGDGVPVDDHRQDHLQTASLMIHRSDSSFLFMTMPNPINANHERLVDIFRKTHLLNQYRRLSDDSMAVDHSQLWMPMELIRSTDVTANNDGDDDKAMGRNSFNHLSVDIDRSIIMTSLSIRIPPLQVDAILIHIDALHSLYLQTDNNCDYHGQHRYSLISQQPSQANILKVLLQAIVKVSDVKTLSTHTTVMPVALNEGDGEANLSIAIVNGAGYSYWTDGAVFSPHNTANTQLSSLSSSPSSPPASSSLLPVVHAQLTTLVQRILRSIRGGGSYSANFLSQMELDIKHMIESGSCINSTSQHSNHQSQSVSISSRNMRYASFTGLLSSLDPVLLCELVSRLGRKLDPSTSKMLFPMSIDVKPHQHHHTTRGGEIGVIGLFEACLSVTPPLFHYAARLLSLACESLGGTEGHIAATASLILALEFLYLSTAHFSLKHAFECFEFCLRIEEMLRANSTEIMAQANLMQWTSSDRLDYSGTIKQQALELISTLRRIHIGNSSSPSLVAGDGSHSEKELHRSSMFLGPHLVPYLIELGINWLFDRTIDDQSGEEATISVDDDATTLTTTVYAEKSSETSLHVGKGLHVDSSIEDSTKSQTHYLLQSKRASSLSMLTSNALREAATGSSNYRYLAIEALELEYGASTIGSTICHALSPQHLHNEGTDDSHNTCSHGLTISLLVLIIKDLLICEHRFFAAAVVIATFRRNRFLREHLLSLLLQMYADEEDIVLDHDELDDNGSSRHSHKTMDNDSSRGRYTADEKLRRILHLFGLSNIRKARTHIDDMAPLLLNAVSAQYIRRMVEAHFHGAGVTTTGGYFEMMPPSDMHDLIGTSQESFSDHSVSLLGLIKSLAVGLLLVRDRETASLLLRTLKGHITTHVDPNLHLALSMAAGGDRATNEAVLRALI